jgi:uncharacterized membrane protein (TIGR02234 family)
VSARRPYVAGLGLLLLGAVVVLVSAGRTWGTAEVAGTVGSTAASTLSVRGSDVSGGLPAFGLLALAGVLAVVATRGWARRAVGVLLVLTGLTVVLLAARGDLGAALDRAARAAAGVTSARASDPSPNAWRWVCLVGGLLIGAAGGLTVVASAGWPALGARYDRGGARTPRPLDAWSALDRGIDPTVDPIVEPHRPETDRPETGGPGAGTMARPGNDEGLANAEELT